MAKALKNKQTKTKYSNQKTKTTKSTKTKRTINKKIGIDKENSLFLNNFKGILPSELVYGIDPSLNGYTEVILYNGILNTYGETYFEDEGFNYQFVNFSKLELRKKSKAYYDNLDEDIKKEKKLKNMQKVIVLEDLRKISKLRDLQSSIEYLDDYLCIPDYIENLYSCIEHPFFNRFNPKSYSDQMKVYQHAYDKLKNIKEFDSNIIVEVEPKTVKRFITGNGSATKEDMFEALMMNDYTRSIIESDLFKSIDGDHFLTEAKAIKEGVIDAISIAIYGYYMYKISIDLYDEFE